jgi:iron complex transport system substrate-binding protein
MSSFSQECEKEVKINDFQPKYSKFFKISFFKNFKMVEMNLPTFKDKFLVSDKPLHCKTDLTIFSHKGERIIATSTTHLPFLTHFKLEKKLVGFQGVNYINGFQHKIENINFVLNPEELLSLKPDIVIAYLSNLGSLESQARLKSLRKLGIPVVLNFDYAERHPLARAEWLVFNALFVGREKEAIDFFSKVENDYHALKESVKNKTVKKILVGSIVEGRWVMPGGLSDLSILIQDAKGEMLFSQPNQDTQQLSLEILFNQPIKAELWIAHNMWQNKKELKKDSRYKMLDEIPLYNNDKRLNKYGFNDYWQMGLARPDMLLKDLITLFHDEKRNNDKLVWYRPLK